MEPRLGLSFGQWIASRGVDLDGDGLPDVVVGSIREQISPQQDGAVYAFSGRDGSQLHRFVSQPPFGRIGRFVTTLKPPVGEHTGFVVVPDSYANFSSVCSREMGQMTVYRGTPRTVAQLGQPCPGTLAQAPQIGMQTLGTAAVRLHLASAPPGAMAGLAVGLSTTQWLGQPLPLALTPLGFTGCDLLVSADAFAVATAGSAWPVAGYASLDLPLPVPAAGLGRATLAAQWLVLGSGASFPGGVSPALTWRH